MENPYPQPSHSKKPWQQRTTALLVHTCVCGRCVLWQEIQSCLTSHAFDRFRFLLGTLMNFSSIHGTHHTQSCLLREWICTSRILRYSDTSASSLKQLEKASMLKIGHNKWKWHSSPIQGKSAWWRTLPRQSVSRRVLKMKMRAWLDPLHELTSRHVRDLFYSFPMKSHWLIIYLHYHTSNFPSDIQSHRQVYGKD